MKYIYETYRLKSEPPERIDTATRFEDIENWIQEFDKETFSTFFKEYSIQVFDSVTLNCIDSINDYDDLEAWRVRLEREAAWKPEKEHALPSHAKHQFVDDTGFHDKIDGTILNKFATKGSTEKDPVNPPHYQAFLYDQNVNFELQWLEAKCRERRFRENPEHFISALMLQVDKYLDRVGYKDEDLQEFEKGLWYLKFLVAYIKNGKQPIFVHDIENILSRK